MRQAMNLPFEVGDLLDVESVKPNPGQFQSLFPKEARFLEFPLCVYLSFTPPTANQGKEFSK